MVYNQDLSRYNTADITESFKGWKGNKNIAANSVNSGQSIRVVCTLRTSIANSRITAKSWGQC